MNDKAVLRNHIITFPMETKLFWYPHKSTENSKFVVIHSFIYKIYYEIWLKGMSTLFFDTLSKDTMQIKSWFPLVSCDSTKIPTNEDNFSISNTTFDDAHCSGGKNKNSLLVKFFIFGNQEKPN